MLNLLLCWILLSKDTTSLPSPGGFTEVASSNTPLTWQGFPCIRQSIERLFFNTLKNGMHLFVALKTNLFRATTFPVKLCTSFTVFHDSTSIIAFTLFGFASIPHWDTMNPENSPEATVKTHFARFNFILYLRSVLKVSFRSSK